MLSVGQIVYSKCGRDRGKSFIVLSFDEEYVYLVDGILRPLNKPKKKKIKHIQITHHVDFHIKELLVNSKYILDSDIKKALLSY